MRTYLSLILTAFLSIGLAVLSDKIGADTTHPGVPGLIKITTGTVDTTRSYGDKINENFQMIGTTVQTALNNIASLGTSTGALANAVGVDTTTLKNRIDNVAVATGTLQANVGVDTTTLANRLDAVAVATGTIGGGGIPLPEGATNYVGTESSNTVTGRPTFGGGLLITSTSTVRGATVTFDSASVLNINNAGVQAGYQVKIKGQPGTSGAGKGIYLEEPGSGTDNWTIDVNNNGDLSFFDGSPNGLTLFNSNAGGTNLKMTGQGTFNNSVSASSVAAQVPRSITFGNGGYALYCSTLNCGGGWFNTGPSTFVITSAWLEFGVGSTITAIATIVKSTEVDTNVAWEGLYASSFTINGRPTAEGIPRLKSNVDFTATTINAWTRLRPVFVHAASSATAAQDWKITLNGRGQ